MIKRNILIVSVDLVRFKLELILMVDFSPHLYFFETTLSSLVLPVYTIYLVMRISCLNGVDNECLSRRLFFTMFINITINHLDLPSYTYYDKFKTVKYGIFY